jgi:hypothetical protein
VSAHSAPGKDSLEPAFDAALCTHHFRLPCCSWGSHGYVTQREVEILSASSR